MQQRAIWYRRFGTLSLLLGLLAYPVFTTAQTPLRRPGPGAGQFPASVAVKVVPATAKAGDSVKLAVTVSLDPGFHTYDLVQPEMKELASELSLQLPNPLQASGTWTGTPPEEEVNELLQKRIFVHHVSPTWEHAVTVPAGTRAGEYKITTKLRLTVCNEFGCLPPRTESFEVKLNVEAAEGAIAVESQGSTDSDQSGVDPGAPTIADIESTRQEPASASSGNVNVKAGSAALPEFKPKHIDRRVESIWGAIGFGLLAGLILNVMPCVLPVISLKVYGFVKEARQEPARVRLLGLSFSSGIIFVFLIFGAMFAYGGQKWGNLFQSDEFVVSMVAILVLCAMWMFEVIVFNPPGIVGEADARVAERKDLLGEFFKGMLATVLSTPCSGPLLIPVISFAIGNGAAPVIFATLSAVGVGMALPYIVLACHPAWMRILPKPGDWMRTFKEFMAFLLLGTAIWLLWTRRSKGELVFWTVTFSSFVAMAGWMYGRCADPLNSAAKRLSGTVLALLLVVASAYFCFGVMYESPQSSLAQKNGNLAGDSGTRPALPVRQDDDEYHWRPFDLDAVLAARAGGRTVVVDWTADW